NCHPSVAVFPALLAVGEQGHIDGRTFLTAMAVGYEALCRIGSAATRAVEDERGFHGPGTNAPFGAAAGAGKALGFSAETMVDAIQAFRNRCNFSPTDIDSVHITGSGRFFEDRFGERRPTTMMGAQYSLPWSAALALARDIADPRAWSEDDLGDPAIGRLAEL